MSRYRLFHLRTLPHAAIAIAACGSALAQTGDPLAGAALYVQKVNIPGSGQFNCEDCHATGPLFRIFFESRGIDEAGVLSRINGAIGGNRGGMGAYSGYSAQNRADVAAFIMRGPASRPSARSSRIRTWWVLRPRQTSRGTACSGPMNMLIRTCT